MKKVYIKLRNGRIGNESIEYMLVNCYRYNAVIGVCITKSADDKYYTLTDYRTGYYAGKSFKKLKDAYAFLDNWSSEYNRWLEALEIARKTIKYSELKEINK